MPLLRLTDMRSELLNRLRQSGVSTAQRDLWLNMAQDRIAAQLDLDHLEETATFATVASTRKYYVNADFNRILSLIDQTNGEELSELTESRFESIDPDRDETGQPRFFAMFGHEFVEAQPSSASVVTVVSSSASDSTQNVRINGIVSGELDTESLALNGTSDVAGTKSFTTVHQIVKDATSTGRVTATSNAAAVTLAVIPPNEVAISRQPVFLYPVPSSVITMRARYYRRPRRLVNAEDLPDLPPDYHELVIILATAIGHTSLYNFEQAQQVLNTEFNPFLDSLKGQQGNRRFKRSPIIAGPDLMPRSFSPGLIPERGIG